MHSHCVPQNYFADRKNHRLWLHRSRMNDDTPRGFMLEISYQCLPHLLFINCKLNISTPHVIHTYFTQYCNRVQLRIIWYSLSLKGCTGAYEVIDVLTCMCNIRIGIKDYLNRNKFIMAVIILYRKAHLQFSYIPSDRPKVILPQWEFIL